MAPQAHLLSVLLAVASFANNAVAFRRPMPIVPNDELAPPSLGMMKSLPFNYTAGVPQMGNSTFQQLIDHKNPSLGTFSQFYFYSDQYYAGPGSPVILFTPGEANVTGYTNYLTNKRLTGLFAEAIGAAIIVIEHRYWGHSSPFTELTTENLQYLTLDNAIADLTNFARNADLPFDRWHTSAAPRAPWLLSGGSYSGALTAWTAALAPGTFYAYTASSAVVETIYDFWQYFEPVKAGLTKNCTADLEAVVDYVDNILVNGTAAAQTELKGMFGLAGLEHNDDFAVAIESGPWLWQSQQFYTGTQIWDFCDAVEGVTHNSTVLPGPEGVGVQKALAGYANWFKTVSLPGTCASYGYSEWTADDEIGCYNTYNATSPLYTDISLAYKTSRQWEWMLCNEPFGWWQDGAPKNVPSIVSRLVTAEYFQRQCGLYFPPSPSGLTYDAAHQTEAGVNNYTNGWDMTIVEDLPRLLFVNGEFDPWRDATVSSDFRPGGPLANSTENPIFIIPKGIHCSDLVTMNGAVNAGVQAVIDAEVAQVTQWFQQWPKQGYQGWPAGMNFPNPPAKTPWGGFWGSASWGGSWGGAKKGGFPSGGSGGPGGHW